MRRCLNAQDISIFASLCTYPSGTVFFGYVPQPADLLKETSICESALEAERPVPSVHVLIALGSRISSLRVSVQS